MKKVSIGDIATQLGVSKTLVSLVLNNRAAENGISKETERKVLDLAEKLRYQPNQVARGLRLGRSHTLGLIVSDISNSFFARIGRSIEDHVAKAGYNVIFCSSDERTEKEENLLRVLKDRQVDGLIISPTPHNQEAIRKLREEKFPFVLIDRHFPDQETSYVMADNYQGASQAIEHLIKLGHHRIGQITIFRDTVSCMQERWRGYKDALVNHGIPYLPDLVKNVRWDHMQEDVQTAIQALMKPPRKTSALFITNNRLTIQTLAALKQLQINIPDDLALVGFDDLDLFQFTDPPVTAVAQDEELIGAEAVRILLAALQGSEVVGRIQVPALLRIRRSCGS